MSAINRNQTAQILNYTLLGSAAVGLVCHCLKANKIGNIAKGVFALSAVLRFLVKDTEPAPAPAPQSVPSAARPRVTPVPQLTPPTAPTARPALPAALAVPIQSRLDIAKNDNPAPRTKTEIWEEDISRFTHGDMNNYFQALARQHPTFTAPSARYIYEVPADGKIVPNDHRETTKGTQSIAAQIKRDLMECHFDGSKKIFAYPVLTSKDHWTLVVVDREKRSIEYYNSFGAAETDVQTVQYLEKIKPLLNQFDVPGKPYTFSALKQKLQSNLSQCGPWTLFLLQQRLEKPGFDFNTLKPTEGLDKCLRTFRADARAALRAS